MINRINNFLSRIFFDSEVNKLLALIVAVFLVLFFFLKELSPILGALLIAYVLDGAVKKIMIKVPLPRTLIVSVVVVGTTLFMIMTFYFSPQFFGQLRELSGQISEIAKAFNAMIATVNSMLPTKLEIDEGIITEKLAELFDTSALSIFDNTLNFFGNLFSLFVYVIILPMLVFFMLKDKYIIFDYLGKFIPKTTIHFDLWSQINEQMGSYIRGKLIEMFVIGILTWYVFFLFQMKFSFVLAVLVGVSVFIPFIGAVAVTIPVLMFAFLSYGFHADFFWVVGLYTLIQVLDGQLLVPLLFAGVVNIHPVALIASILFFGNLWGFWGIFFAIPLASVIKCIVSVIYARYQDSN